MVIICVSSARNNAMQFRNAFNAPVNACIAQYNLLNAEELVTFIYFTWNNHSNFCVNKLRKIHESKEKCDITLN